MKRMRMKVHRKGSSQKKPGRRHVTFYERVIKRPQDMLCAAIGLVVLSPVLLVLSGLVKVKLGSPELFCQERPGLRERVFKLYKFRTMTDERGKDGKLLPDEVRLTKFGKWLRSTSLDELPELWNILKGDMSLVGPRPLLVEYLPRYSKEQRKRHLVRPGLTGLAQVNGRNGISWKEKFELDVKYVEKVTFLGDWKILLDTVGKVLKKDGIYFEAEVTTGPFEGNGLE